MAPAWLSPVCCPKCGRVGSLRPLWFCEACHNDSTREQITALRTDPAVPQQEGLDLAPIKCQCAEGYEDMPNTARGHVKALITEIERKQARIQVLETSVDYLRYLVDHPVTQEDGLRRALKYWEAKKLALDAVRPHFTSDQLRELNAAEGRLLAAIYEAAPPVAPAEGEQ